MVYKTLIVFYSFLAKFLLCQRHVPITRTCYRCISMTIFQSSCHPKPTENTIIFCKTQTLAPKVSLVMPCQRLEFSFPEPGSAWQTSGFMSSRGLSIKGYVRTKLKLQSPMHFHMPFTRQGLHRNWWPLSIKPWRDRCLEGSHDPLRLSTVAQRKNMGT